MASSPSMIGPVNRDTMGKSSRGSGDVPVIVAGQTNPSFIDCARGEFFLASRAVVPEGAMKKQKGGGKEGESSRRLEAVWYQGHSGRQPWASPAGSRPGTGKIRIITIVLRRALSEIKLKRTDTTLDLSQKAKRAKEEKEKRFKIRAGGRDYIEGCGWSVHDGKVATVDTGRKPHRLENPRVESDSRGGGAAVGCTAGAGTHARQAQGRQRRRVRRGRLGRFGSRPCRRRREASSSTPAPPPPPTVPRSPLDLSPPRQPRCRCSGPRSSILAASPTSRPSATTPSARPLRLLSPRGRQGFLFPTRDHARRPCMPHTHTRQADAAHWQSPPHLPRRSIADPGCETAQTGKRSATSSATPPSRPEPAPLPSCSSPRCTATPAQPRSATVASWAARAEVS